MGKKLSLEKMNNTRELGGLVAANGHKIKDDTLYRSGHLFFASKNDLDAIQQLNLSHIVDLRSPLEQSQRPDPAIEGTKHISLPAVTDELSGITRDEESDEHASEMLISRMSADKETAINYMVDLYENLVSNEYCLGQYHKFMELLADNNTNKILWHCTAGKDRAGLATVFTLEILGVNRDDIIENYLETNVNLKEEIDELVEMLRTKKFFTGDDESIRTFFGAREEYIQAMYKKVSETYGSFQNFIKNGLGVTAETVEKLRSKYLV
ncbi:MAG: tyrosine-protein phosphatase [Lachnospiraceae bacterium]|nr:tyrosine-protein phosphatase [Lachnospiraceae bacterium]